VYHPAADGNGSVTAWTQSGAAVPMCVREYDAFGNVVVEQGSAPCSIGFSTKIEDPESGLLYYGHRYYCPPLGRWLNQDPIEERGGLNLYGFVGNDGVNWLDVLGLLPGEIYSTVRAAALAALNDAFRKSQAEGIETCGWIIPEETCYTYTEPANNLERSPDYLRRIEDAKKLGWDEKRIKESVANKKKKKCWSSAKPKGAVADYHTHGTPDPKERSDEYFSKDDFDGNDQDEVDGYLATSRGRVSEYKRGPRRDPSKADPRFANTLYYDPRTGEWVVAGFDNKTGSPTVPPSLPVEYLPTL